MKHRKKKKGASLIIVLMVLAVAMIFSSVTLTTISKTTKANAQEKKSEDVLFSAESGLEYGIAWFNKNKTTGVISVPPTNGCTYDVKVEPDGSNYKIISKATINGKSKTVIATIEKTGGDGGSGGGNEEVVINVPVSLIVPANDFLFYKNGGNEKSINNVGVDPLYHVEGVINYTTSRIYNIFKTNWGTNVEPTVVNTHSFDGKLDVGFKKYSLTPFKYQPQTINIPSNTNNSDIVINNENFNQYFGSSNTIISNKKITIDADYRGEIDLSNKNIYATSIELKGYKNIKINNCQFIANDISLGDSGQLNFSNSSFVSKNLVVKGSDSRIFSNSKLYSDVISIEGSGIRDFISGTEITAKTFMVNVSNPAKFDNIKLSSESITIGGSTERTFTNSKILANDFKLDVTNGSTFANSEVTAGNFVINGSCDKLFDTMVVKANTFKISSSNEVKFNNVAISTNNFEITGSTNRTFYNSAIISEYMNIYTSNNIYFNRSLVVSNKIKYMANYLEFIPGTASESKDIYTIALKYITTKEPTAPTPVKYELKSIKYE
ncbi:pilus assembly PilX N-terminal domain-containing protein [Clostridium intestinale]|uniref:Pilus assembly PilX N-terminal domain-containing protein n=1 Tax=Clostridium intestinale TaxID=36845 RepID=A0A7D6ZG02_9CLOT|nr:pilus assembly PilX N-terminal domain-containing protein [Clostridium intestinale]QLY79341.1 pilus assembly PilX N-terminal domain-containing protein [Clostridium intestinale]